MVRVIMGSPVGAALGRPVKGNPATVSLQHPARLLTARFLARRP